MKLPFLIGARRAAATCASLASLALACAPAQQADVGSDVVAAALDTRSAWSDSRTNVVLILTDDQRWDTLDAMPYLTELADAGVRFDHAVVTTPACTPSRASILAGGFYAAETGILTNTGPNAAMARFRARSSLAASLQGAGYATAFVGKYMNNFPNMSRDMLLAEGVRLRPDEVYIPPGWTEFAATTTRENRDDNPWHRFMLSRGSSSAQRGTGTTTWADGYVEAVHRDLAFEFLDRQSAERPFFLMIATHAPHAPAIPESEDDAGLFADFVYRERGYAEADVDDKPQWVPRTDAEWRGEQAERDAFHRDQLRSLQSIDRLARALVERLGTLGLADDTLVVFTSDNGQMWGEHRDFGKNKAFEESIRVPLVAWRPGMTPARVSQLTAVNLDVPATILDIAGLDAQAPDVTSGLSLGRLLDGDPTPNWRSHVILESYADPIWVGVRTLELDGGEIVGAHKYVEYHGGDRELYDLSADAFELESRHDDTDNADLGTLQALLPGARGPAIVRPVRGRNGRVGRDWEMVPEICCNTPTTRWSIRDGALPPGVTLDPTTGRLSGTPTAAGSYEFVLAVHADVEIGPGRPGDFAREYTVTIRP